MSDRAPAAAWFAGSWQSEPFGDGHINDTYLVTVGGERFILQRINERVFHDAVGVMRNIERVLAHVVPRAPGLLPELVPLPTGEGFLEAADGCWRLWRFVEHTRVLAAAVTAAQASAAGAAFGRLHTLLAGIRAQDLIDPIEGFGQLDHYLNTYDAVATQRGGWDDVIDDHRALADRFRRTDTVIHGDCKLNNVLFEAGTDRVRAIVDLDTVMRGHWAWDAGDLIRSIAHLNQGIEPDLFASVAAGFVGGGGTRDVDALVLAPCYVTVMLGVRFLTDHLLGDRYFKVTYRGENAERAAEQFALLADLNADAPALAQAADRALDRLKL